MRILAAETERVESGPIQFGNDWPGFFMRGDDAFSHSMNISTVWNHLKQLYGDQKMPMDLYFAMLQLASFSDDVQTQVICGGQICPLISEEVRNSL
jgi:hypothetical protein